MFQEGGGGHFLEVSLRRQMISSEARTKDTG